jgi:glutamate-1-semialdehyde aminotransferase
MVTGFRAELPGAYVGLGLTPDLVTWGKAIGNGFSFCALTGRAEIMELGGIRQTEKPRVFLLSTTHGGEAHTLAATRAVIREYREHEVIARQHGLVARVAAGMRTRIAARGLGEAIEVHASPWRAVLVFKDRENKVCPRLRTLMMQEMIGRGVLFQGVFMPCFMHADRDVDHVLEAFDRACEIYRHALGHGVDGLLIGSATRPVFRKFVSDR